MERKLHYRKLVLAAVLVLASSSLYVMSPIFAQTTPTVSPTPTITATVLPTVTTTGPDDPTVTPTATPTPTPKPQAPVSVRISVGTQYPWNKRIPVTLYITPTQSGAKLQIQWQRRSGLLADPLTTSWSSPQAGQTYSASFTITPQSTGYQRAVADVIITTLDSNYVYSQDLVLNLDADKVVQPQPAMYTFYVIAMYTAIVLVFFVGIPFGLYQSFMYAKKNLFPQWLESKLQKPQ